MAIAGSQNSGVVTTNTVVYKEPCRLVSIHAANSHASQSCTVDIFDDTVAQTSGKLVAKLIVEAGKCVEYDMHSCKMLKGIYIGLNNGAGHVSVTFA
tara:strand:+ start:2845 stop:3135 length:291 start_codon:yes stop_codon:yes gene_type:complete